MKKFIVTLTEEERNLLAELTFKGKHRSQKILNALILMACDEGEHQPRRSKNEEISRVLNTSMRKIDRVKNGLFWTVLMLLSTVEREAVFMPKRRMGILKPIWLL